VRLVINHRVSLQGVPITSEGTCQSSFVDEYEIAVHLLSTRNDIRRGQNNERRRAQNAKRCVGSGLIFDLTPVLLIDSLCYNKSAPVTAGTLRV